MKTIEKTTKYVIVEITEDELLTVGFDKTWDNIREIYPNHLYEISDVKEINEGKIFLAKLTKKENQKLI